MHLLRQLIFAAGCARSARGNLCNASPAADLSVALMAMKASVVIVGSAGQREISIKDFFTGFKTLALQEDELLCEIRIPAFPEKTCTSFHKLRHHQTSVDIAIVNVATRLHIENGKCVDAAIAMGAVAPMPLRAKRAEDLLIGKNLNDDLLLEVSRIAMEESAPIDDLRASADYRRKVVGVLVKRSLETNLRRCGE